MNWNQIKEQYPKSLGKAGYLDENAMSTFFDDHGLFMLTTYEPEHPQPWGWELYGPRRFVREQCQYTERVEAEAAGFEQAFAELERLLRDAVS